MADLRMIPAAKPRPNPEVRHPAGRKRCGSIDRVIQRSHVDHVTHREVLLMGKVERKPRDHEIERVGKTKAACGSGPE